jgi:hypothetical protein
VLKEKVSQDVGRNTNSMPLNHSKYSNLTEDQFTLMGKIMIEFSNIDFLLGVLLSRLTFTRFDLSRTITEKLTAHNTILAIEDCIKMHDIRLGNRLASKEISTQINSLLSEIKTIILSGNKFAHHLWARSDDNSIIGTKYSSKQRSCTDKGKDTTSIKLKGLETLFKRSYSKVETLNLLVDRIPERTLVE